MKKEIVVGYCSAMVTGTASSTVTDACASVLHCRKSVVFACLHRAPSDRLLRALTETWSSCQGLACQLAPHHMAKQRQEGTLSSRHSAGICQAQAHMRHMLQGTAH